MGQPIRILYLEDNQHDFELIRSLLLREGLNVDIVWAGSKESYEELITREEFSLILSDFDLPSYTGEKAFEAAKDVCPETPFIIVTGALVEDTAIDLLRRGVTDYLMKNRLHRLVPAVKRALVEAEEKKKLAFTERKIQSLVNNLPGMLYRCKSDESLTMDYVSEGCFSLTGYSVKDFLNDESFSYTNIIHPDDRALVRKTVQEKISLKQSYIIEYRIIIKEGSEKWVWEKGNGLYDQLGKLQVLEGLIIDISDRKKIEKELQESESRFKAILNNTMDAIVVYTEGRIVLANQAFKILHGYGPDEDITGVSTFQFLAEEERDRIMSIQKKRLAGEDAPVYFESKACRKDGSTFDIDVHAASLHIQGKPHAVSIIRDISQRKQNEREIKLNEARLESLLQIAQYQATSLQDLLDFALEQAIRLTSSKLGYIYFYNEVRQEFTLNTWSKEVMEACSILEPQTTYFLEKTGLWGEAVRQNRPIIANDFQSENSLKKGYPERHAHLAKFMTIPVIIDQEIKAVVGVANKEEDYNDSDIRQLTLMMNTVWRIYEKAKNTEFLEEVKEQAEITSRIKSSILKNLNHEFRTPMNSILGFSDLLTNNLSSGEHKHMAAMVYNSANRLMETLNSLILLAELESGEFPLQIRQYDLCSMLEGLPGKYRQLTLQKDLYFNNQASGSFPVLCDQRATMLVIEKVIGNAVKFTKKGGITLVVEPVQWQEQYFVDLKVIDTGIGIPEEQAKNIFEAFYQISEGYNREFEGSGLGLSLSRNIMNLMGGEIMISSASGEGSTVTIRFPGIKEELISAEGLENSVTANGLTVEPGVSFLHNPTVLLVEDNMLNTELVLLYLKGLARLEHAPTGEMALEMALSKKYDIILMDINLGPGIDGLEVTRLLRKEEKYNRTPIVAVTGYTSESDKSRLLAGGCSHFLPKPFNKKELITFFSEVLSTLSTTPD